MNLVFALRGMDYLSVVYKMEYSVDAKLRFKLCAVQLLLQTTWLQLKYLFAL